MKLSVSLPADDVDFLDEYAQEQGLQSRSAVIHHAVNVLRSSGLETAYEKAWQEWDLAGAPDEWERVAADGLEP